MSLREPLETVAAAALLALTLFFPLAAAAEDDEPKEDQDRRAAQPCLHAPQYDDFDFWLGDWDVYVGDRKVAENVITKELDGCLVRERYHNERGYRGESLNYYDPQSGRWKQNWVDKMGGVVRYEGGLEGEGVMAMQGANTGRDGTTKLARVKWTRQPDGHVRHLIEQSADGGATWQVFFDALYKKSGRAAGAAAE